MLQDKAMLANLSIRQWSARKLDRKVSAEVAASHGAKNAGNFNKLLLDEDALKPLSAHSGKVREYHYKQTLPWGDNGDRLLSSMNYLEYMAQMRIFNQENDQLADDFVQLYPSLRAAAPQRLGTLYDPYDYPPDADIRSRFGISISVFPVPSADDFRVDIGQEDIAKVKAEITAAVDERSKAALKECWTRLQDVVTKIEVMMLKEKPIFRDSLIENAEELVIMLPRLNISGDKELNETCEVVRDDLCLPPTLLRSSPAARSKVALAAASILRTISFHV